MVPGGIFGRFNQGVFDKSGVVSKWVEGVPDSKRSGYMDVKGKEEFMVTSYRCMGCGYLESYAYQEQQ